MKKFCRLFGFKSHLKYKIILLIIFVLILHYKFVNKIKIDVSPKYGDVFDDDYFDQKKNNIFGVQRNEEWEQLSRFVFFKRSASYFFIDQSILRSFFVALSSIEHNYYLHVKIFYGNESVYFQIHQLKVKCELKTDVYDFCSISANFDLLKSLKAQNQINKINNISKMEMHITDQVSKSITQYPIYVKVKYLKSNNNRNIKKNGYAICNKCYEIKDNDTTSYKTYEWWLEANKRMGFNKAILCNVSMPNTYKYNNMFYRYKDFIEIHELKFIPNLIHNLSSIRKLNNAGESSSYFRNYSELKGKEGNFSYKYSGVFQNLRINECYLDNVDKYEYIAIIDIDELIIPRNFFNLSQYFDFIINFKFDSCNLNNILSCLDNIITEALNSEIEYTNSHKAFSKYVDHLYPKTSLHFSNGYYLKYQTLDQIMSHLDNYINNKVNDQVNYYVFNISDYDMQYNFSFVIESQNELKYSRNIVNLYKFLLKPKFISPFEQIISENSPSYFNRIAYLAHNLTTRHIPGKTVHYTDMSYFISIHYTTNRFVRQHYEVGHVSHFRPKYTHYLKNELIPIRALAFDLNYLYCYYKHNFNIKNM